MILNNLTKQPNILMIITDQERAEMHWPEGWAEENLPAMQRLKANGLSFNRAYIATAACSPSRASLFTGLYPAQHGVTEVLQSYDPYSPDQIKQRGLSSQTQNMAKMLASAGYNVVYKGKWHLTKPAQFNDEMGHLFWSEADVDHIAQRWGFTEWNQPDGGDGLKVREFGGGSINHDGRWVGTPDGSPSPSIGRGGWGVEPAGMPVRAEDDSVLHFLNHYDSEKPFCLIVSLVNPHDVLAYPGTGIGEPGRIPAYQRGGYELSDFADLPIELPPTVNEDLRTKPTYQRSSKRGMNLVIGRLRTDEQKRNYCRFYAYLHTLVDAHIKHILDTLDANNLTDDTLIVRLSDHGEMGMAHGGLRQKFGYVYEETVRVPLIFSNPTLFPQAQESDELVSLVDVLPTLCTIAEVPHREQWTFKGQDLTPILQNPEQSAQDALHFTYDDAIVPLRLPHLLRKRLQSNRGPTHIRAIIERDWKYAVYFDPDLGLKPEYELYHLANDPLESENLAHRWFYRPEIEPQRRRLHNNLIAMMESLGTMPDEIIWPTADEFEPM